MSGNTYASPMSYVGSTRRLAGFAKRAPGWWKILSWTVVVPLMVIMWAVVSVWYVVVFGVFWFVAIPFRLIRRSQRKTDDRLRESAS